MCVLLFVVCDYAERVMAMRVGGGVVGMSRCGSGIVSNCKGS